MSQNPPVDPEIYSPSNFVISNISKGSTTTVTTSEVNNFVVGQLVRFHIPIPYGIRQLNEQAGYVISLTSTTICVVDINSSAYDSYISTPTYPGNTSPQVSAIGDKNLSITGLTVTGAFQQIT